jgi:tryptophan 7-halogenase
MMKNKKITIVGGGTAGWLTSLYIQKLLPYADITVIESDEIGILGAGEGTTPNIIDCLNFLDIDYKDVIKETHGSLKIAIKFENWNKEPSYYYHPFLVTNPQLSEFNYGLSHINDQGGFLSYSLIANNTTIGRNTAFCHYADNNKSPFFMHDGKLTNVGLFALHFDARLLANYLRSIAESRGIIRVEGNIKGFNDNAGFINKITLENNSTVECDFVFDCSGFQRLIIGKFHKSRWKSYKEFLPVDSALAFFLPTESTTNPYTTATAMKYGWMWKIPLQHRIGCGYVYDSSFIDEHQAKAEIEQELQTDIEVVKIFKFDPGCFEETWIKNCISIGVSTGFTEPLEATSIMLAIKSLETFKNYIIGIDNFNQDIVDQYNTQILDFNSHIMEFLYAHYLTDRNDTAFWKKFSGENAPKNLSTKLKIWDHKPITIDDSQTFQFFGSSNWMCVLDGLGKLKPEVYQHHLTLLDLTNNYASDGVKLNLSIFNSEKMMIGHQEYLNYINSL